MQAERSNRRSASVVSRHAMPNPYRIRSDPAADVEELGLDPDPMRRQRRVGLALAFASLAFLVILFPLGTLIFVFPLRWFVSLWLFAAVLEVLSAVIAANLLFTARSGDRTRAQRLCTWVGGVAVVLAVLGSLTAVAEAVFVGFVMSLGPWCGVCGT